MSKPKPRLKNSRLSYLTLEIVYLYVYIDIYIYMYVCI